MLRMPKWLSFYGDYIIKESFSGGDGNTGGGRIAGVVDFVAPNGDVDGVRFFLEGIRWSTSGNCT